MNFSNLVNNICFGLDWTFSTVFFCAIWKISLFRWYRCEYWSHPMIWVFCILLWSMSPYRTILMSKRICVLFILSNIKLSISIPIFFGSIQLLMYAIKDRLEWHDTILYNPWTNFHRCFRNARPLQGVLYSVVRRVEIRYIRPCDMLSISWIERKCYNVFQIKIRK